ncbi:hypothetical protein ACQCSX_11700 [Pseudarthrobacter sp. P1]|uniref:hypothetical protein n=1 Tax=Pseudarthrobacter sp. P1 TaxID=3418418 RepID=UPI003CF8C47F
MDDAWATSTILRSTDHRDDAGSATAGYSVGAIPVACSPAAADLDARLKTGSAGSVTSAAQSSTSTPKAVEEKFVSVDGERAIQTAFTLTGHGIVVNVVEATLFSGPHIYTVMAVNPPPGSWEGFLGSFKATADPAQLPECEPPTTS